MEVITHTINNNKIAEVLSNALLIKTAMDGLDLLGSLYYQGFDRIIIYEKNITPDFFELKNGMAGNLLQKFSNYRVRLAIVGEFTSYPKKSINAFMLESNRLGHISFVNSSNEAIRVLSVR